MTNQLTELKEIEEKILNMAFFLQKIMTTSRAKQIALQEAINYIIATIGVDLAQ